MMAQTFITEGYHGYNIKFSPFSPTQLACVGSQNYGIAGHGALFVLDMDMNGIQCVRMMRWPKDGLYDLCWSEVTPNIIWTCSGDGNVQVWDINFRDVDTPVMLFRAHLREVASLEWSQMRGDRPSVLTSSWDGIVKVWDALNVNASGEAVAAFEGHAGMVYSAHWSPLMSGMFASTSADTTLKVWNVRDKNAVITVKASQTEVLSCDWCKYNGNIISTGATDGMINFWDIRNPLHPLFTIMAHSKAVRKVKFSPFSETIVASCSYDCITSLWDTKLMANNCNPLLLTWNHHREFVYGLDFSIHTQHQLADCSWDQLVHVFHTNLN